MEKWKQVAMDAAVDEAARDLIPDRIEQLEFIWGVYSRFFLGVIFLLLFFFGEDPDPCLTLFGEIPEYV